MDEDLFEPRLGRVRAGGSRRGRKYLHSVLAAAARAGASRPRVGRRFTGSRIGRGGVAALALGQLNSHPGLRSRRAIVKTRLVRLGGRALGAARAHLRYIQRDGVSRAGEPGRLYSAAEDRADGRAFLERSGGDRHQFRLIVSAEDGDQYDDLRPLIRRLMARMGEDLGTRLEWVAADHVDTLHPHTHIMLRGVDERGGNLVIAPDYIRHGMRERLAGLVSLDLGPRTDLEIADRLRQEVTAERLTSLDRRLLREADASRVFELRGRSLADHALQVGRLRKLSGLGIAGELGGGRWQLADDLEAVLRRLGERGDVVRTMQRALKAAGMERAAAEQVIHPPGTGLVVTGRIVERGLADELRDRHYLIVDAVDGRTHYVDVGRGEELEQLAVGSIVRLTPRRAGVRESDRRIADIAAANRGRYAVELHLPADPGASAAFAQSHVRRLEAIRRGLGGIERLEDGSWSIPSDFLERAGAHEEQRRRDAPVLVELLSPLPLERLPTHDGATWLDRQLVTQAEGAREAGFGRELAAALAKRRVWLVEQGLAIVEGDEVKCRPDSVRQLQQRELQRAAAAIAGETGLEFLPADGGTRLSGIVRRRVDLASGRYAVIDDGRSFALVPWKPVLGRALGREVSGVVRPGGVSWTIGRERGPAL